MVTRSTIATMAAENSGIVGVGVETGVGMGVGEEVVCDSVEGNHVLVSSPRLQRSINQYVKAVEVHCDSGLYC
jgi:hypothetical protein